MSIIIRLLRRPKVRVHFCRVGGQIECRIQNMPSRGGYLLQRYAVQSLGVRIGIIDIEAREQDELSGTVYYDERPRRIRFGDGEATRTIVLPASQECVRLPIARANKSQCLAIGGSSELTTRLRVGTYRTALSIGVDGREYSIEREFEIRQQKPYARWIKDGTVKL